MLKFEKYKKELKKVFPVYSDEQLEEYFNLRVDFWECIVDNIDRINLGKSKKK